MQIIDVRQSDNQLQILGGALVLPTSDHVASTPLAGSLRWNVNSLVIEYYSGVAWTAINFGGVDYQGTWNANTNTPELTSGIGVKGQYYKVSVSGSTMIDGNNYWLAGDSIIFDGSVWDKISGIDNFALSDLTDVNITSVNNGNVLSYDGGTSKWVNIVPPYDVYGTFIGSPSSDQMIWRIVFARTVTFPASLPSSVSICQGAPTTVNTALDVSKNGISVGTITFFTGTTNGVFTWASDVIFNNGDILEITAPSISDSGFFTPSWAFVGYRS